MSIYAVMFAVAYFINILSIISILFIDKKEISVTLGWIMVFIFLPFIGFVFYFFFGSTVRFRIFSKKYVLEMPEAAYGAVLKENIKLIEAEKLSFSKSEMQLYGDIVALNAKSAESVYTEDNNVTLLTSAQQKYDMMLSEIENAAESVNVLYFIIKAEDEIGKKFISLLAKKAREGVEVRLIYDMLGFMPTKRKHFKELTDAGGMVYSFLPSVIGTLLQANYRMHRKLVIIDGKSAYTGGINIGDDYLGKNPAVTPWRDTSVRITGTAVQAMQLRFLSDWAYLDRQIKKSAAYPSKVDDIEHILKYFKCPDVPGEMGVQILSGGPDKKYSLIKDSYIKMIMSAKKYIYIQTPYMIPDETLLNALRIAAYSGIDVRVMIPGMPDKKFVYYATMSYVETLLGYRIKVYRYNGFIHSKTLVADDFISSVGTANFDIRSFNINFELNAVIYDRDFAVTCRNTFFKDIESCREIGSEEYRKRSRLQKLCEGFWRLITPLA